MLEYTGIKLQPANWVRCLTGALTLALKVWDDEAIFNDDLSQVLSQISTDDL